MTIDLNSMSLNELKDLKARVSRAIASFDERRRKEVIAELEEAAKAHGFTLSELTGLRVGRKRAASTVTYANPSNPAQTWNGRGRKPGWFIAALEGGASAESLKV